MDWDKFKARFPDAYEALELLAALQPESSPQKINEKLRGAIRGRLGALLGEDGGSCPDGRYFLKALWGIEGGSTLKLSQTQGNMLGLWLRGDGNEEALPGIVDALRVFEGAQASEAISAERKAEGETEIQRVAQEIGAEIKEIDVENSVSDITIVAKALERTPDSIEWLKGLAEAPASTSLMVSLRGFGVRWTLRDWSESNLLIRTDRLLDGLEELGAYPADNYGNPIVTITSGTIAEAKQTTAAPAQRAAPRQQSQTTTTADGYEKFLVKEIVAQVVGTDNDKYAVRGGRYMKYGVTAWHEVAEQVHGLFDDVHLDDLAVNEAWSATGRNLFALAEKPEDKEFANKVIEFVVG